MAAAQTVPGLLRAAASRDGHGEFLRHTGTSVTFADAEARVDAIARGLRACGVGAGERVAFLLPNGIDVALTWLGILAAGAVAVPVNVRYRSVDLAHVLHDSGTRVVVTTAEGRTEIPGDVDVVDPETLRAAGTAAPPHPLPTVSRESTANLQYTSGTTGPPKACILDHDYWLRFGNVIAEHVTLDRADVVLTAQPFSYADPQWNLVACLAAGATLVIAPGFSASGFWPTVRREGITFVYTIGAMPVLLLKQPPDPLDRDHRVRVVLCSGIVPAMHAALEQRWGVPWREAFGTTETGPDLLVPLDDNASVGTGAVGLPVIGKRVRVVDADGADVPQGSSGELVVAGRPMMRGYWNRPEDTARVQRPDGMHTGDIVTRDERGYVHVVGRLKDMIRRGGENVSAAELEGVLCRHDEVINAAAVPVPDDVFGEEIRAVVHVRDHARAGRELAEDIAAFTRDRLAAFKVPRYLSFVESLPLTPSGRVVKRDLPPATSVPTVDLAADR